MKIKVTKQDIEDGIRSNSDACPVALAVRRAFKLQLHDDVCVTGHRIHIKNTLYFGPRWLNNFVGTFDCGGKVKPVSFEIKKRGIKL